MLQVRAPAESRLVIVGGGPAGLAAAYEAARLGVSTCLLERDSKLGGLARTEALGGYLFDLGGHRFFTKAPEVLRLWNEVLGLDLLRRPRLSRIYFRGRFMPYPLEPVPTIRCLGPAETLRVLGSYLAAQFRPRRVSRSFEDWVSQRFGERLYRLFFKAYTEKVWGIPCAELKSEWAAQRLKDLSMTAVILHGLKVRRGGIRTLSEEFLYPRLGVGMMWGELGRQVAGRGVSIRTSAEVCKVRWEGTRVTSLVISQGGGFEEMETPHLITSMPLCELFLKLDPPPPPDVLEAARSLSYRAFVTVCVVVAQPQVFPDNWIYVHDPEVQVARIQNFKNWSPDMVPDLSTTSLGLEYFCDEGDSTWNLEDAALIERAGEELERIGLVQRSGIRDGCVFRIPKAYPIYDSAWERHLPRVTEFLGGFHNCQTIGRNGLHRYNNQDHSMLTGMLAVRNAFLGERHDIWAVNADSSYHEAVEPDGPELPGAGLRG